MVGNCKKTCSSRKDLNKRHLMAHPKIVCDICNKIFDTPIIMNRHRYSHKAPKHFYSDCGKGFFFESELTSHRLCHLKIPGYSCFAKNCRKSYKKNVATLLLIKEILCNIRGNICLKNLSTSIVIKNLDISNRKKGMNWTVNPIQRKNQLLNKECIPVGCVPYAH